VTVSQAVIIGAIVISGAILAGKLVTPYQVSVGSKYVVRLNTITGSIDACEPELARATGTGDALHAGYSAAEAFDYRANHPSFHVCP